MLIILFALSLCVLTTALVILRVEAGWFTAIGLFLFTLMILGEGRFNLAFAREYSDFSGVSFNYFIVLSVYFIKKPKEPIYILGVPAKGVRYNAFTASTGLTIVGFGTPLYYLIASSLVRLESADWALILLSIYMGILGVFLFKRAWRVRTLRLELQHSLEKR